MGRRTRPDAASSLARLALARRHRELFAIGSRIELFVLGPGKPRVLTKLTTSPIGIKASADGERRVPVPAEAEVVDVLFEGANAVIWATDGRAQHPIDDSLPRQNEAIKAWVREHLAAGNPPSVAE